MSPFAMSQGMIARRATPPLVLHRRDNEPMADPFADRKPNHPMLNDYGTYRVDGEAGDVHYLREGTYSSDTIHWTPISRAFPWQGFLVGSHGELDTITGYGGDGAVHTSLITAITKVPEE
jgi:hypothetical protein